MTTSPLLRSRARERGTTLIEILVTVVILAFGLLGIAAFQMKGQIGSMESYQRAQAVVLMEDMHARMSASPALAASYVTTGVGTDDAPAACGTLTGRAARDLCEWSQALRGTAAVQGTKNVGAMIGARGCISQLVAANPTDGACQQGIYLVSVAWQGLHETLPPATSLTCGATKYGSEGFRRVVATRVSVAVPGCLLLPSSNFRPIP